MPACRCATLQAAGPCQVPARSLFCAAPSPARPPGCTSSGLRLCCGRAVAAQVLAGLACQGLHPLPGMPETFRRPVMRCAAGWSAAGGCDRAAGALRAVGAPGNPQALHAWQCQVHFGSWIMGLRGNEHNYRLHHAWRETPRQRCTHPQQCRLAWGSRMLRMLRARRRSAGCTWRTTRAEAWMAPSCSLPVPLLKRLLSPVQRPSLPLRPFAWAQWLAAPLPRA